MVPLQGCLRIVSTSRRGVTSEQWRGTVSTSHPGPHRARHCRTDPCPGLLSSYPNHISVKVKMGPLTSSLRRRRYTFLLPRTLSMYLFLSDFDCCRTTIPGRSACSEGIDPPEGRRVGVDDDRETTCAAWCLWLWDGWASSYASQNLLKSTPLECRLSVVLWSLRGPSTEYFLAKDSRILSLIEI